MMADTMDYEAQREQLAEVAMQIILHAGDARNLVMEALDEAGEGRYQEAEQKLVDAKEELRQAHVSQTGVVQSEAAGTRYEYSLLFTHAQDTLMTINSEVRMAQEMIQVLKVIAEKIG